MLMLQPAAIPSLPSSYQKHIVLLRLRLFNTFSPFSPLLLFRVCVCFFGFCCENCKHKTGNFSTTLWCAFAINVRRNSVVWFCCFCSLDCRIESEHQISIGSGQVGQCLVFFFLSFSLFVRIESVPFRIIWYLLIQALVLNYAHENE